jgi:hypothetical protein
MKWFIFLCVLHVLYAKHTKEKKKCEGIQVDGKVHEEEVLINGIDRPYQLSYHGLNKSYELYFSYNTGRHNESSFEIGYSKKGWVLPSPIKNVTNGFATAINHRHGTIYFGGSNGIYIQNISTPGKVRLLIEGYDIWDMFFKDELYFISFPKRQLHKHCSNNTEIQKHLHNKIFHFAIDGDEDQFVTNKTGLYMIKNGTHHPIHLKGPTIFRAIEVNNKGIAHFCGQNEIYVVDKKDHKLREIASIKNIFGLTFDEEDNIIYSDPHQIVRLLPKSCKDKS